MATPQQMAKWASKRSAEALAIIIKRRQITRADLAKTMGLAEKTISSYIVPHIRQNVYTEMIESKISYLYYERQK